MAKFSAISLVLLVVLLPLLLRATEQNKGYILFALWPPQIGKQPEAYILDPVVKLDGASMTTPINYEDTSDKSWNEFENKYFAPGSVYPLLFGGSQLGRVSVEKGESISCESLTATARVSRPTPGGLKGLAITSLETIRLHENWRHLASDDQKLLFINLALDYLKLHGASSARASSLKIDGLAATKLGANGPEVLIGNVSFAGKTTDYELFMAMDSTRGDMLIASIHESKDLRDDVDSQIEKFLDQLDLDNDGVDEIITISGYYESWDYAIYKEVGGVWKQIYKGGGEGC